MDEVNRLARSYKGSLENHLSWTYVRRGENFEQYLSRYGDICISLAGMISARDGLRHYELKISSASGKLLHRDVSDDKRIKDLFDYIHGRREEK